MLMSIALLELSTTFVYLLDITVLLLYCLMITKIEYSNTQKKKKKSTSD